MIVRCVVIWIVVFAGGYGAAVCLGNEENISWKVEYRGSSPPQEQGWTPIGGLAGKAKIVDGALQVADDCADDMACFRATWNADPTCETIVEAKVRVVSLKAWRGGTTVWPWRDGAPVGLLVSDGRHQEGLSLCPRRMSTFMDRFFLMDTTRSMKVLKIGRAHV